MTCFRVHGPAGSNLLSGIGAITGAVLLLSLSDALVKVNNAELSLGQVLTVRSAVAALCLWAVLRFFSGRRGVSASVTGWVWVRSLCLALMWGSFYAALPVLPFSVAAACYYTSPMWMAVLSCTLLGTRIGLRGLCAVALGLGGVLTMLRPGLEDVSPLIGLPLLAGFFYALAAVVTQARCREVPAMSMAMNLNVVLILAGLALIAGLNLRGDGHAAGFLLSAWPRLDASGWALLIGLGVLLGVITALVAYAYRSAPAPVIGLFDNGYLVFALVWDIVIFSGSPGPVDILGVALIGSGAVLATGVAAGRRSGLRGET
ncbi:MAG: DMT family transporter [Roseovarius sp.]